GGASSGSPGGRGGGSGGGSKGGSKGTARGRRDGPPAPLGDRSWIDVKYGITLIPPDGWKTIPAPKEYNEQFRSAQAAQVNLVQSFQASQPDAENYLVSLDVLSLGATPDLDGALAIFYAVENEINRKFFVDEAKPAREKVGGQAAAWLELTAQTGFKRLIEVVHGYGEGFALVFCCSRRHADRKAGEFHATARTFAFLNDDQIAKLAGRPGGASALTAGWSSLQTAHYEIEYNCDRPFAELMGRHLEGILKEYQRRFPLDLDAAAREAGDRKGYTRFTVKAFKTYDEFAAYAAANDVSGAAAYFSPAQNELVCFKTTDWGKKLTLNIMYHEASHQYIHLYMGGRVDIPTWLDEGVAEYFFGGEFQPDGSFVIGVNRERVSTIKDAIRHRTHVPLAKFFQYTQSQYYADGALCYAEGWAIVYFLWRTPDPQYAGLINKFYDALKLSRDADRAFKHVFGGVDLDKLQADWEAWMLTPGALR
ncbi:MAG: DUF1570 domain-containing protein, partial [Planctomycetes bacterium]|nr:DUF1570 domain-containing protein [Planctomycetota bacterium]